LTAAVPVVLAVYAEARRAARDAREVSTSVVPTPPVGGDDATDRAVDCTAGLHEDDTAVLETFTAEEPEAVSVTTPVNHGVSNRFR